MLPKNNLLRWLFLEGRISAWAEEPHCGRGRDGDRRAHLRVGGGTAKILQTD